MLFSHFSLTLMMKYGTITKSSSGKQWTFNIEVQFHDDPCEEYSRLRLYAFTILSPSDPLYDNPNFDNIPAMALSRMHDEPTMYVRMRQLQDSKEEKVTEKRYLGFSFGKRFKNDLTKPSSASVTEIINDRFQDMMNIALEKVDTFVQNVALMKTYPHLEACEQKDADFIASADKSDIKTIIDQQRKLSRLRRELDAIEILKNESHANLLQNVTHLCYRDTTSIDRSSLSQDEIQDEIQHGTIPETTSQPYANVQASLRRLRADWVQEKIKRLQISHVQEILNKLDREYCVHAEQLQVHRDRLREVARVDLLRQKQHLERDNDKKRNDILFYGSLMR